MIFVVEGRSFFVEDKSMEDRLATEPITGVE